MPTIDLRKVKTVKDFLEIYNDLRSWSGDVEVDFDISEPDQKQSEKNDQHKLRYDLIPYHPLNELVKNYTQGANEHGDRNWEIGFDWSRCFAAIMRHAWLWYNGEDNDNEPGGTGLHHMTCVAFWAFALVEYAVTKAGKDDRP